MRQIREERESRESSESLARELPPLMQWIPQVSPDLDEPLHLADMTDLFQRIHCGETLDFCISVPPRHGKTVTALHGIVWLLIQHPDWPILFVSYSLAIAKKMVVRARKIAVAAGLRLGGTQTREYWETAAGGSLRASGLGGQLIGDGFKFIFTDDPHKNQKEANSRVIRQRVSDGFASDVYTRKLPSGTSNVVNHQRWHPEDLIGHLSTPSEENPRPFALINIPAITLDGKACAPWLWPLEELLKIKARNVHSWEAMYMGNPRPKGGTLFIGVSLTTSRPIVTRSSLGVDLARSAKQRSDHHAMVQMVWSGPVCVIVDIVFQRGHVTDIVENGVLEAGACGPMHAMQLRAGGVIARWYAGRDETTYSDLLAHHATTPVHVRVMKADADKWVRAQPYAAAWNGGLVHVLDSCRHRDELLKQHRDFTGIDGNSDDIIDACVAAYDEGLALPVVRVTGAAPRTLPMRRADGKKWT